MLKNTTSAQLCATPRQGQEHKHLISSPVEDGLGSVAEAGD